MSDESTDSTDDDLRVTVTYRGGIPQSVDVDLPLPGSAKYDIDDGGDAHLSDASIHHVSFTLDHEDVAAYADGLRRAHNAVLELGFVDGLWVGEDVIA